MSTTRTQTLLFTTEDNNFIASGEDDAGSRKVENDAPCCGPDTMEGGDCCPSRRLGSTVTAPAASSNGVSQSILQEDPADDDDDLDPAHLDCFSKWLSLWVLLSMIFGTVLGFMVPAIPEALEKATVYNVWVPGAVLVWLMVYPMMLGVRWSALRQVPNEPRGLFLTTIINWAVQPFVMYGLAVLFFRVIYDGILDDDTQDQFIAGAVILGGSPCTAMVFVWSALAHGDPNYTLVQVLLNDLILLVLYVPTTKLLLQVSDIALPWGTVFLSVVLFVVVPFALGTLTHLLVLRREGGEATLQKVQNVFKPVSGMSLLLLVVFVFISQAQVIVNDFVHVLLVMVPLVLQTCIIFVLTYWLAYFFCLRHDVAGPAVFVGSSNFFELAIAIALTVYGPQSGAVLVTVVGVLVEVPVMLMEVMVVNATKGRYERRLEDVDCRCKKSD